MDFCMKNYTMKRVCLTFLRLGEQNQGFLRRELWLPGCCVSNPESNAAVTNPHSHSSKAMVS